MQREIWKFPWVHSKPSINLSWLNENLPPRPQYFSPRLRGWSGGPHAVWHIQGKHRTSFVWLWSEQTTAGHIAAPSTQGVGPLGAHHCQKSAWGASKSLSCCLVPWRSGRHKKKLHFPTPEAILIFPSHLFPWVGFFLHSVDRYYIITLFKYLRWWLHHHSILIATSVNMSDVLKRN